MIDHKSKLNLTEAKNFITKVTFQAGEVLRKYYDSGKYTQRNKEGVDFTTQADEEVDKFLREAIIKQYPHTSILTEETAPKDYTSFEELNNLWIIDPLDGTINFSRKHPNFAISVALVDKGISKLGVVYIPLSDQLYWAHEDTEGAFLNDEKISVSETQDLTKSVIACDWAWDLEKRLKVVAWVKKLCTKVRQIKSMGSAVSDLASLGAGRIDGYIHSGLKPWDVAASSLILEKAGGKVTTPLGKPWNVFHSDMLATNDILHQEILNLVS